MFSACSTRQAAPPAPVYSRPAHIEREHPASVVKASWYGPGMVGQPTSSGELYDPNRLTAASKTLPIGSVVQVKNPNNGRSVNVRINDCGPYVRGRSLDLSHRAAQKLGITHAGVAAVQVTKISTPPDAQNCGH